jgi:hypothetical protein
MRIFISWSGDRSREIADVFRRWLPGILQATKPYFSPDDIAKGARWESEISKELAASQLGLLILTPENVEAPWLVFEAGALAKNLEKSKVCPLLFGLEATDVKGPLVHFQGAKFEESEIKRVVKMVNSELGEQGLLDATVLDQVFEMWWPRLHTEVTKIIEKPASNKGAKARSDRDILEEVLALVRSDTQVLPLPAPTIAQGTLRNLVTDFDRVVQEGAKLKSLNLIRALLHLADRLEYLVGELGNPDQGNEFRAIKAQLIMNMERSPGG